MVGGSQGEVETEVGELEIDAGVGHDEDSDAFFFEAFIFGFDGFGGSSEEDIGGKFEQVAAGGEKQNRQAHYQEEMIFSHGICPKYVLLSKPNQPALPGPAYEDKEGGKSEGFFPRDMAEQIFAFGGDGGAGGEGNRSDEAQGEDEPGGVDGKSLEELAADSKGESRGHAAGGAGVSGSQVEAAGGQAQLLMGAESGGIRVNIKTC